MNLTPNELIEKLADILGPEGLVTDRDECEFYCSDVYQRGQAPLAVIRPDRKEALSAAVAVSTSAGMAIVPRGGGMSYTGGYVPPESGAVIVDLGRMDRIIRIDPVDMVATVEAGCTWEQLRSALAPHRLRARAWGTLSGLHATVGGGMSQNGVFWGAREGTVVDGAVSFEVVLADGRIIETGTDFFRPYGPDLTGLFAADTGALGIKTEVTLQLVREGASFAYGSYAFDTGDAFFAAMSGIAREGLASESFGFDPFLQAQRMKRDSLAGDARSLVNMMKAQGSAWKALKEGAKVVAAGRSFLEGASFSLHVICEGRSQAAADADLKAADSIVLESGGRVVENTIPKIVRANPFPPVNSMVGPSGERFLPVHGFLPHSKLVEAWDRLQSLFEARLEERAQHGIEVGAMLAAVNRSACLIEPVFYWPDELHELHRRSVQPDHLARLQSFDPNPEARAVVADLRREVIAIFRELGAAHLQIGRTYPLDRSLDPGAWALLRSVKQAVDPANLMNPGSLGL